MNQSGSGKEMAAYYLALQMFSADGGVVHVENGVPLAKGPGRSDDLLKHFERALAAMKED